MTNTNGFFSDVAASYPDCLRDESRRTGKADSISFPKSETELRTQLTELYRNRIPVTSQGARTGITGGAVPNEGHIINLHRMNNVTGIQPHPSEDAFILTVQPGLLLCDLRLLIEGRKFDTTGWSPESLAAFDQFKTGKTYFFPPDPTEASASIGGMVSCNASGARSFFYGPTRNYMESMRIILADGSLLGLKRGGQKASGLKFSLTTDNGGQFSGTLPAYVMPEVKNASGYFAKSDMDILDLFIGSEGTLGIFSELGLKLVPVPAAVWGVMTFFPSEETALNFVTVVRAGSPRPTALEFFDCGSLNLLRKQKETNPAFSDIPAMSPAFHTAVYIEYHGPDEQTVEQAFVNMAEIMTAAGGDSEATWMASDRHSLEDLKSFRHALPEAVNLQIDERRRKEPGLTKLGTDLSVPDNRLDEVIKMYRHDLAEAGLEHVIFGHIGNNHLHVNIIPNSMAEHKHGKDLYLKWAARVVEMGGSVSAEHGIGKLKTDMLRTMFGEEGIRQMKEVKACFDPQNLLNRGNLFT